MTEIDFRKLAEAIKEKAKHVWELYEFIYYSKELRQLNESLEYGHSSLRNHLLLIANLVVQDYLAGRLDNLNHREGAVTTGRVPLPSK